MLILFYMKLTDNKVLFYSSIGVLFAILILILLNTILFLLAKRKKNQIDQERSEMSDSINCNIENLEKQHKELSNIMVELKKRQNFCVGASHGDDFHHIHENISFYIKSNTLFNNPRCNNFINRAIHSLIRNEGIMANSLIFEGGKRELSTQNPHDLQKKLNITITEDQKNDFEEKKIELVNNLLKIAEGGILENPNNLLYRYVINNKKENLNDARTHTEEKLILKKTVEIVFNKAISEVEREISEIDSKVSKMNAEIKEIKFLEPLSFFNPIKNIKILNYKENSSEQGMK